MGLYFLINYSLEGSGGGNYSSTLSENSWGQIADAAAAGKASELWKVGDKANITVKGISYPVQIIGFDHDDLDATDDMYRKSTYNGGKNKAAITFQIEDCWDITTYRLHSSQDNSMSWNGTEMRQTTLPTKVLSNMDSELSGSIRTVTKYTASSGASSVITDTSDQLFLLSEIEVFGTSAHSYEREGTQYEFWSTNNTNNARVKKLQGSVCGWWLRSPYPINNLNFDYVEATGASDFTNPTKFYGVSFAFCI